MISSISKFNTARWLVQGFALVVGFGLLLVLWSAVGLCAEPVRELDMLWKFRTIGGSGYTMNQIVLGPDDTIYVAYDDDNKIYAFTPDGKYKWDRPYFGSFCPGPAVGPDGTIYCQKDENTYCALKPDGSEKWTAGFMIDNYSIPVVLGNGTLFVGGRENKLNIISGSGASIKTLDIKMAYGTSPALGADGLVYVSAEDQSVYIFDATGKQVKRCSLPAKPKTSPLPGPNGTFYVGCEDKYLYAIGRDGTWKWKTPAEVFPENGMRLDSQGTILFATADNKFLAVKPDGSVKWQSDIEPGFLAEPAIGKDGCIYVRADKDEDDYLVALDKDGKEVNDFQVKERRFSGAPVIGSDGTLYIGNHDSRIYAYAPDGHLKWRAGAGSYIKSNPVVGRDGTVYFGANDEHFYAVKPDGSLKWGLEWDFDIDWDPVMADDGTIYAAVDDTTLFAISPQGRTKWTFSDSKNLRQPAVGLDGTVYLASEANKLYALKADGTKKWEQETETGLGIVYTHPSTGLDGTIYHGVFSIRAISPDGKKKWEVESGGEGESAYEATLAYGTFVVTGKDGMLYALTDDDDLKHTPNKLLIMKPNGEVRHVYSPLDNPMTSPVIAPDGTVYISHKKNHLLALEADGTKKWEVPLGDGGHRVTVGPDGLIYSGCTDGQLYIISPEGKLLAQFKVDQMVTTRPVLGADGAVYFGCWDSYLYAVKVPGSLVE